MALQFDDMRLTRNGLRRVWAWLGGAALLILYTCLPAGDDPELLDDDFGVASDGAALAIVDAMPHDAVSGSAIALSYVGAAPLETMHVWLGKRQLPLLVRRRGTIVVELPAGLSPGRAKLRLVNGSERSRAYELKIKARDWQKPLRNLLGGLVLLVLGVQQLARAACSLSGLSSWRWPARAPWQLAALGAGTVLGALTQSTTAAAGLLAGGVSSRRLALQPAAAAFLGAQLGAAAAPFLFASATEPHTGLLAVAIGGLGLAVARVRHARALGWLVLSGGLVTFAVQVLRPDLGLFLSSPGLWEQASRVWPQHAWAALALVPIGALLVALFQGPAPVLVLAAAIAQIAGHDQPRTTLILLSGTGLGSALAAIGTTPRDPHGRCLAELNLLVGLCSTCLTAVSAPLVERAARGLTSWEEPIHWGSHFLPASGWHVALAFALSQLMAAAVLLPLLPLLERFHARLRPLRAAQDGGGVAVPSELQAALAAQAEALPQLLRLAIEGERTAGSAAERSLQRAGDGLRVLFRGAPAADSGELRRMTLACSQLQRALVGVLWHAERLIDERIAGSAAAPRVAPLPPHSVHVLRELHALLGDGLTALQRDLERGLPPDREQACAREIMINALESQLRLGLAVSAIDQRELAVVALVDALESAGNQLYRLADACGEPEPGEHASPPASPQPMAAG